MKKSLKLTYCLFFATSILARADVPIAAERELDESAVLATLENEHVMVAFLEASRDGQPSARPAVRVRRDGEWIEAPLDAPAESYRVVSATDDVRFGIPERGYYAQWTREGQPQPIARVAWQAGENREAVIRSVEPIDERSLKLRFHPLPEGELEAIWSLAPGEKSIKVAMEFRPTAAGQYSLGYFLFRRESPENVDEFLLPPTIQARRFPSQLFTYLQTQTPTPMSLMQIGPMTWTVAGDPDSTPFEFPVPAESRYGLQIRDEAGNAHPSIFGPLAGTPDSMADEGDSVRFTFRVLVQPGDWYAAYRTVADEVFDWRDYRKNDLTSLTEAAFNMIDLYMDDEASGWWERAKASHQIESKNGSTQSTPLTVLSLYRLTGDPEIYQRRVVPTLEFLLSRQGPHFSPIPEDTGGYPKGSMNGPVDIFGSTVYAGLSEMANHRTHAIKDAAFPGGEIRLTTTQQNFQTNNQPFDELLGRHIFLGDEAALESAIRQADEYIAGAIHQRPDREVPIHEFFLMAYTPSWQGLLGLYEVTGEQRFLDAAVIGARMVMTGIWTQPSLGDGEVTIHPGDDCHGDKLHMLLHRGADEFRLGWPRKPGDTPEKQVPAWRIANAGLSLEQPTTHTFRENGGRLIYQVPWAPGFLRLARHTGDPEFEIYARNAVVGRFGNYPGYYYTTFSDVMHNPRFPYEGPDMSFIYYHHIPVHLSWTIDYLVNEAALRSQGRIQFPALRQFGYAYFDNLVYGHEPGEVYGENDMWLWFDRDLLTLDNPQINHLTAQNGGTLAVILTNANREPEKVTLTLNPEKLNPQSGSITQARFLAGGEGPLPLANHSVAITIPALGQVVLAVDGLDILVPSQQSHPMPQPSAHPGQLVVPVVDDRNLHAAAIQIEPGAWNAFVWTNAGSGELREATLSWRAGEHAGTLTDTDFPYEFSVPVPAGEMEFRFSVRAVKADGTPVETAEQVIGISP